MTRFISLAAAVTTILCIAVASPAEEVDRSRPNILVIYADDLGYGDVQCYNTQRGKIPTPHIDALAAQGMRFTDAHSSSGVCSPSRYTILTGRYHWRTSLQSGIVGLWKGPLIAPDRMTIGSLAKQQGYRTACIGKWHLGWDWPIDQTSKQYFNAPKQKDVDATDAHRAAWKQVFSKPIKGGPSTRGFDEYFGTDVPNWPPYCFIRERSHTRDPDRILARSLVPEKPSQRARTCVARLDARTDLARLG